MNSKTDTQELDDDTLLSAYLDGELPDELADRVTGRIAREPGLARRLAALRQADADTRAAFAALDETPMPQAVLDLLDADRSAPADNVVAFPARGLRRFLQLPVALAASVALLAGFVGSELLRQVPGPGSGADALYAGAVLPDSEVYRLLETGISAEPQTLDAGTTGMLVMTFEDRDGDYCRQFLLAGEARTAHAVACRRDADWQLEALSFAPAAAGAGPYQQASAGTRAVLGAAVEQLLGAAEPLDKGQEKALISEGWKKPAN